MTALQTALSPGEPVVRELVGGETHSYQLVLKKGDYVETAIDQRGIDVAAKVLDPGGAEVRDYDTPTGALGPEHVRFIATAEGTWRLTVRALQPEADRGRYEIRVVATRAATDADKRVEAAVKHSAEADTLRASAETRAHSVARYQEARRLWQIAGDPAGEASALRALGFAYVRLKQDGEAAVAFTEAQRMFRQLGDTRADAYIHLILANIHTRSGDLKQTLAAKEQALPLWRAAKDTEQETLTLTAIGTTYARLGNAAEMRRYHADALAVARATGRPSLEAAVFQSEGAASELLGDRGAARSAFEQALRLWQQAGKTRAQAAVRARLDALGK